MGYRVFERTVNVLLSAVESVQGVQFELQTDQKLKDPLYKKQINKVCIKTRENASLSRPDAELVQINEIKEQSKSKFQKTMKLKKLKIVVDAKYYTSQLEQDTINKTIDDMKLRCDDEYEAFSFLICSNSTKLDKFLS